VTRGLALSSMTWPIPFCLLRRLMLYPTELRARLLWQKVVMLSLRRSAPILHYVPDYVPNDLSPPVYPKYTSAGVRRHSPGDFLVLHAPQGVAGYYMMLNSAWARRAS
jgi:hypothetical protein